jgi:hypothetical protein
MRTFHFKLLLFISVFCFFNATNGQGADWIYLSEPEDKSCKEYYDVDTITVAPDGIVRVWSKRAYTDSGRTLMLLERQKAGMPPGGYENLDALLALNELSCKKKEYRVISVETYERGGRLLDSVTFEDKKWKPISPETPVEALFQKVCNKMMNR